jgi:hypothetical protein
MADDLGLSDRDKEMAKWNGPYVYRPYPKMLYRGTTARDGRLSVDQRIVGSEQEEREALEIGWVPHPQTATEAEEARQERVGTAAAERAWGDRRLSPAAQADAAAVDAATARHLGEIPETPKRLRRRPPQEG